MTGEQIARGPGLLRSVHIDHLREQQLRHGCFRLIGVDERRVHAVCVLVFRREEFAHGAAPFHSHHDGGQLIPLEEFLNGCLDHPFVTMVVDKDHFAIPIVPEAEHGIDQRLLHDLMRHNDRARHADMMVRMPAIVERRQRPRAFAALLGRVAADALQDLRHHKGIETGVGVFSVVFRAADGNEHDIVFPAFFDLARTGRRLNIAAGFSKLRRCAHPIFLQNLIDLLVRSFPELLLHLAHTRAHLKADPRIAGRIPRLVLIIFHIVCLLFRYLWTLPVPSPPMSFSTSETPTRLKSPITLCFRQLAATANSSACFLSS